MFASIRKNKIMTKKEFVEEIKNRIAKGNV